MDDKKLGRRIPRMSVRPMARFFLRHWIRHDELVRVRQQLRYMALGELLARSRERPIDLSLYELSVFSQNGEDGVLAEILGRIGSQSRYFVEVGASHNEANCVLLADAFGWSGLFLEADSNESGELTQKYAATPRVRVVQQHVTRENFTGHFLRAHGVPKDFDVLSIDIDGNDYWIWEALADPWPRVVVIEYNSALDPNRQLVQPYDPDWAWNSRDVNGASLGALRRLAKQKGYRLVHVELTGTNAFFVRMDVAGKHFVAEEEVTARAANHFLYGLRYPETRTNRSFVDLSIDAK